MDLKAKLLDDLRGAQKAKDSLKIDTLRLVHAEIKNKEIDLRKDLEDEAITSILTTQIKKRKEAAIMFEKGGRSDLKEKEESEIEILQVYLPEQVGEDELRSRIQEIIAESGAQSPKDMGKVMKQVVPEFRGRAEGDVIKNIVSQLLSS